MGSPSGGGAEVRLLGDLEVVADGHAIPLAGERQRVMLAMLVLARGAAVPHDTLAEELWGSRTEVEVASALQNVASRLRRALAPAGLGVGARPGAYVLDPAPAGTDADRFERMVAAGQGHLAAGAAERALTDLQTALGLWRGRALGGLAERAFARAEAARLDEARRAATESLADALLAVRRPGPAAALLERLVAEAPYREQAWGRLMLALYRAGRQADALAVFRDVRRLLAEDLGLQPGPSLRALEAQILAQHPELDGVGVAGVDVPSDPAAATGQAPAGHNLPAQADRFLGRTAELAELDTLAHAERMVTLWGPGGVGKTRLSLELATRTLADFPDGSWFVDLAPIDGAAGIAPAVSSAVGLLPGPSADPAEDLARLLAPRHALVVLDNCEHVVTAAASLARMLLARCPGLHLVATSRELLGVPGEVAWPVPPLSLPADPTDPADLASSDAVGLFVQRARAAQPAFCLTAANSAAVAEICARLDGVPLAIELAAARVRVLGVKGIAQRLDARLGVLTGGPRTADPRHQTLRSAVDWSYDLLPPAERELLACLSVFSGSFDLPAAEAVAPPSAARGVGFEVLDLLSRLVDKSLVTADGQADGGVRYRLLETIRQYAAEKLHASGGDLTAHQRHLTHYRGQVSGLESCWSWEDRTHLAVARDYDNLITALAFAVAQSDAESALALASGLGSYWIMTENPEGRAWFERALELGLTVRNTSGAGVRMAMAFYLNSAPLGREALELAEQVADPASLAGLLVLAGHADISTDQHGSRELLEQGIALCRDLGDVVWEASGRNALAWSALGAGDYRGAVAHAEVAVAAARPHAERGALAAQHLATLAVATALVGQEERAEEHATAALAFARRLSLRGLLIIALSRAVTVAVVGGRWERVRVYLRELLALLRRVGTRRWVGEALESAALYFDAAGQASLAAETMRAARAHRGAQGERFGGPIPALRDGVEACALRLGAGPPDAGGPALPLDAVLRRTRAALDEPS